MPRKQKTNEPRKTEAYLQMEKELQTYVEIIESALGKEVLEDYYVNPLAKNTPTLLAKRESYKRLAKLLKNHPSMAFDYLSELHGTDFQTHMEVFVYLFSFERRASIILKTQTDRENPEVDSLTSIWAGADWPECETYDLLGIQFKGHPNLHRIFLGEDWKGYPLRKDYVDKNDDFL